MITQAELKRQLHYDPETGIFRWIYSRKHRVAGGIAGTLTEGYISISLIGRSHFAHRLAWLYTYGYFPEREVDHRNGVGSDNRIKNLRHVSRRCNMQNTGGNSRNSTGFNGVCLSKGAWFSNITVDFDQMYLGSYNDPLEAALARYTCEVWHEKWTCNHRSNLVKAIKAAWPEFNPTP